MIHSGLEFDAFQQQQQQQRYRLTHNDKQNGRI